MSSKNRIYGGDAQAWMNQVTNGYPHQAENASSNHIKLNNPPINQAGGFGYVSAPSSLSSGGKRRRKKNKSKKGGYGFSELAVPAILLIANQKYGKKTGKKNGKSKRRFSRRRR